MSRTVCSIRALRRAKIRATGTEKLVRRLRLAAAWAIVPVALFTASADAREGTQDTRSGWSGVYTAAQADRGEARTVGENDKRDVMAYLLQQNGFPAGSAELAHDDAELATVQITGKNGPAPLRTGAIVRVAGCLAQRSERDWELTSATEPERT